MLVQVAIERQICHPPTHHPDDQQRHESAAQVRAEHRAGGPSARLEVLHVETRSAERCIDDGDAKAVMRA